MKKLVIILLVLSANISFGQGDKNRIEEMKLQKATFGAGCFWCVEAIFQQLEGVKSVISGYMGGDSKPTYEAVCTGETNHVEVVHIEYDESILSYVELLEVFWKTHDPTTLNQQGADKGTQYRSVVFYHNEEQKDNALALMKKLSTEGIWEDPIVTAIEPAKVFYVAEEYHQDYYNNNGNKNPYCSMVITPKVEKFRQIFKDKLKE